MAFDEGTDLRTTIAAAMKGDDTPAAEAAPVKVAEPVAAPVDPAPAETEESASDAAARVRDEQGRFAAKEAKEAQATKEADQPATETKEAPTESILPPASWSVEAKSKFKTLDPVIQQEVLKRERDIDKGFQERAGQIKDYERKYEPLESVIGPHRDKWAMHGMSEAQAIGALVAAQNLLERDPVNGLHQLARSYGVDLRQFAQGMVNVQGQPQQQAPQPQLPPEYAQLLQKFTTLEQTVTQRQQADEDARRSQVSTGIQQFAADPKNLYFENVRGRMASLLESGDAKDLPDAYEQACWANPDIRRLIQADQSAAEQARQAAKAQQARQSSGSVIGSPAPGAGPAVDEPAPSLRDQIKRSMAAAQE